MSRHKLTGYIDKIKKGLPINRTAFTKLVLSISELEAFDIHHLKTIKAGAHTYLVTHIDDGQLAILADYVDSYGVDRVTGALQGNSHSFKVNGSLLLTQRNGAHPTVIMFKNGQYYPTKKPTKKIIIVENKEMFIHADKTLRFLEAHCGYKLSDLAQMDMILGSGREITNSLHTAFLSECEEIYLCLDFDLGGITIAKSLINSLSKEVKVNFVVPADIEQRLTLVTKRCTCEYMQKVHTLKDVPTQLMPYIGLIIMHQKVLEQEAYLHGF